MTDQNTSPTPSSDVDLMPCPFDGGSCDPMCLEIETADECSYDGNVKWSGQVVCEDCGSRGPINYAGDENDAISLARNGWNNRALSAPAQVEVTDEMVRVYKDAYRAHLNRWLENGGTDTGDGTEPSFEATRAGLTAALTATDAKPVVPAEPVTGPVPTVECEFRVGQPVHMAQPYAEDDPNAVYWITGITWDHRRVPTRGWNIWLATSEDIAKGYGQTDGFAPSDIRPARLASEGKTDA